MGGGQGVQPDPVGAAPHRDNNTLCDIVSPGAAQGDLRQVAPSELRDIYLAVAGSGKYNFGKPLPSDLIIPAWRWCLDSGIVNYLEFGWPINHDGITPLHSTTENHPSALAFTPDVDPYVEVKLSHRALTGPFQTPPLRGTHFSPLMTKPTRDSKYRRVIMDLSWPTVRR